MIRCFFGLFVALLPLTARAEMEATTPSTPPPQHCPAIASIVDGRVRLKLTVIKMVPYTVTSMVPTTPNTPALKTIFVPKKDLQYKACTQSVRMDVDGTKVKVLRKGGKAVDPKLLPRLLGKGVQVLVFTEGEVDPYYLDVVRDDVLLITIPPDMKFPFRPTTDD